VIERRSWWQCHSSGWGAIGEISNGFVDRQVKEFLGLSNHDCMFACSEVDSQKSLIDMKRGKVRGYQRG
jgi:hypothetical protein